MSDIFREVDEEVRREQLQKIWDRYSLHIIAAVVVFILAVAGWRAYEWYEAKQAAQSGAAFEAAAELSQAGKHEEAQAAFAKVAAEGTAGYHAISLVRAATELAQRDPKAAVAEFDRLAGDASLPAVLKDLAALRAGMILVDTASYEEVRSRAEPLTGSDRAFRHSAREILVLAAWRAGDTAAAKRWHEAMQADSETPGPVRGRVDVLMTLVNAGAKS